MISFMLGVFISFLILALLVFATAAIQLARENEKLKSKLEKFEVCLGETPVRWEGPWNEAKDDAEPFCGKCDWEIEEDQTYCGNCGAKIDWGL